MPGLTGAMRVAILIHRLDGREVPRIDERHD